MKCRARTLNQSRSDLRVASAGERVPATSSPAVKISVCAAARILHRHPATLRRWIQDGAPCEKSSRGNLVDPLELERWYAAKHGLAVAEARASHTMLDEMAQWFWDALKRDSSGVGLPIHRVVDVPEPTAATFMYFLFKYLHLRMFCTPLHERDLPAGVAQLKAIALSTRIRARDGNVPS